MKILLIYSGGLDSTSALHVYKDQIGLAVSFDYGSHHNAREIAMARLNCADLGIKHEVIYMQEVMSDIKSSLLGDGKVPHGHYAEDNMKSTVVPFRNAIMLSIATGIADSNGFDAVMIASHRGDFAQYPDCTSDFNTSMSIAMEKGTHNNIQLLRPFQNDDKREVARRGVKAHMIPALTYSCYEGGEKHCGRCGTCVERIWALKGLNDMTKYDDPCYAQGILTEKGEW
jgi:7-cyano-7-deazaguanine synthase